MRLLIDADQIGTLADRFRGVSMQLLNAAQTVRNDAWSAELSDRDTKLKTATEVTTRVATKYEAHAGSLDTQANDLKQIESLVRGDHGDQAVLTAVPPTNWGTAPAIAPLQPMVTVPKTFIRSITGAITHLDPIRVMPNAVAALQSVPTWVTPTSSTVVEQVTAQLPEEMLPVKPKKKKGFFGRIFSAIGNFFKKMWDSVKKLAKKLWTSLKTTLKGVWQALKNMSFKQLLLLGGTLALQFIPGLGQALAGAVFGAANAARVVTIANAAYRVYNAGRAVYTTVTQGVRGIAGFIGLAGGVSGALSSIGTLGQTIGGAAARVGAFATRVGAGITRVTNFVSSGGIFRVVSQQLGGVVQRVAGAIGSIIPATGPLADVFRVIGRTARNVVDWVKTTIKGVGKVITDARDWVNKTLADVKAKYRSVMDGLLKSIGQVSPKLAELIKTGIDKKISEGLLTVTSVWDDVRKAVTEEITKALEIVRPVGALLSGNHALFGTSMQTLFERTRLWTGVPRAAVEVAEAQLTPVADWTDPGTSETVLESVGTDVAPSTSPDATTPADPATAGPATSDPSTPPSLVGDTGTESVQTIPEDSAGLAPVAVPEEAIDPITKPLPDPVCDLPKEVPAPVSDDMSVKKPDCVMEVLKDPIIEKPLPSPVCDLPKEVTKRLPDPVCVLPKEFTAPVIDNNRSGILPVNDPAALDALRNNLNVITPNAPIATAWVSPVSDTQSSTMQGLLGLVDPTNERSAMLRNLATAYK
jgi:hypothetical protein